LSMEARTAAIGAITSHLIHGLKSPLQGIRQFVTTQSSGEGNESGDMVWQDAAETTERMQNLINEVMEVLQDRGSEFSYEITGSEICSLVDERVCHYAEAKVVTLEMVKNGAISDVQIPNNRANLVILILVNLLRNAIDASSEGMIVKLCISSEKKGELFFEVIDQGGGLPKHVVEHLFQPVSSSKRDGSGVGLSLCQELARHLKGDLELAKTGSGGTVFRLSISLLA
ncbi:MAG: sensor histidine kinase, partial [Verrucomicrobia bacterium]|nr:sensor histidine kinase [Verrucomicrobiota bacterium]